MIKLQIQKATTRTSNKIKELTKSANNKPIIIGISGGSGAGKGYLAQKLSKKLHAKILSLDSYYLGRAKTRNYNFDEPHAVNLKLAEKHLALLKQNKPIQKPVYDFEHEKPEGVSTFAPSKIIIFEGIFALMSRFCKYLDLKIFVYAKKSTRIARRLARDTKERGRTMQEVLQQIHSTVEPMYEKYVAPQKKYADVVVLN